MKVPGPRPLPQEARAAVLFLVFRHRRLGTDVFDLDTIAAADALAQFQRLGELITGFEVEDPHPRLDLGQHVNEAAALGPERGRHGEPGVERVHSPTQDGLRGGTFQRLIRCLNLLRRKG